MYVSLVDKGLIAQVSPAKQDSDQHERINKYLVYIIPFEKKSDASDMMLVRCFHLQLCEG